ncbi:MAG TPA: hypothetical protein VMU28_09295 [Terriglobales bacterium]|nr:hypothetical protein [Terriglobales bacterium]
MKTVTPCLIEADALASLLEDLDDGLKLLQLCRQSGLPEGKLKCLMEHIVETLDQIDFYHFGGPGLRHNLLPA